MLEGLSQKARVDAMDSSTADDVPPVKRRGLNHSGIHTEQGKPLLLLVGISQPGKRDVRRADRCRGKGGWRKRKPACNGSDRGSNFAPRASEQTSIRCLITRKYGKPFKVGKQMAATVHNALVSLAGTPTPVSVAGDGSRCVS
jgi:hypothetical protein